MKVPRQKNIVLFASGMGSNAQAIIDFFRQDDRVVVVHIFCNKQGAGVLNIAAQENIPFTLLTDKQQFNEGKWLAALQDLQPDILVLAGFLWQMPVAVVKAFPHKIINIHPALLPAYGGKGMYGSHVHEAVLENGETQSGITIHEVNEHYDEGKVIRQVSCPVLPNDTPETLAARIHQLEHEHFPQVVAQVLEL